MLSRLAGCRMASLGHVSDRSGPALLSCCKNVGWEPWSVPPSAGNWKRKYFLQKTSPKMTKKN